MRSHHGPLIGVGLFVSAALWASGSGAAGAGVEDETEAVRQDLAFCRATVQAGCQCSFATLETPFTFAEAAGVVATYYREFPDERYSRLLERFLRQCAGEIMPPSPARPSVTIKSDRAAPPSLPFNAPSAQRGGQP
jgi:hypothetical protein